MYPITERFIKENRSYQEIKPIGTVVHETATPGASDENEFNYFNSGYRAASAHAFVDYDSITQTVPWNEKAWHAGQTANSCYIGVELCHYDDEARFNEVWNRAVYLFAHIHVNVIKVLKITPDTLMSHAEVSNRWHETDHTDPVDYFKKFGKSVDMFRSEVQKEIDRMVGSIAYQAHVQNIGWQSPVSNGAVCGTTGQGLRLEALTVNTTVGDLIIEGHVQNIGWQTLRNNGEVIGTVGRGLRLEAVKIRLENAPGMHVEYEAHVQNKGWMPPVRDGAVCGTVGESLRLEALKIKLVRD